MSDTQKALEILTSAEVLTGMDLSTVRCPVGRQADTQPDPQDNDTNREATP